MPIKFHISSYHDTESQYFEVIHRRGSVTKSHHPGKVDQKLFSAFFKKKKGGGGSSNPTWFILIKTYCSLNNRSNEEHSSNQAQPFSGFHREALSSSHAMNLSFEMPSVLNLPCPSSTAGLKPQRAERWRQWNERKAKLFWLHSATHCRRDRRHRDGRPLLLPSLTKIFIWDISFWYLRQTDRQTSVRQLSTYSGIYTHRYTRTAGVRCILHMYIPQYYINIICINQYLCTILSLVGLQKAERKWAENQRGGDLAGKTLDGSGGRGCLEKHISWVPAPLGGLQV